MIDQSEQLSSSLTQITLPYNENICTLEAVSRMCATEMCALHCLCQECFKNVFEYATSCKMKLKYHSAK